MRLATKNELFTLMGNQAFGFSRFCLTPDGSEINFLINNLTAFDLDLPVMQSMVSNLFSAGVFNSDTVNRFAEFGCTVTTEPEHQRYTYRVPNDYPFPPGSDVTDDTTAEGILIITVDNPIDGLEVVS